MEDKKNESMDETRELTRAAAPEDGGKPSPKVRGKDKAKRDIERRLAKKDVWHTGNEVSDAVDALYGEYEADGIAPTREGFAALCANPEVGEAVKGMERDPFVEKPVGRKAIALAAAGVLAAACIVFAAVALQPGGSLPVAGSAASVPSSESGGASKEDDGGDSSGKGESESEGKEDKEEKAEGGGASSSKEGGDAKQDASSESKGGSKPATSSQQQAPAAQPSGNGGGQASSKPQHTHTWVEQTTTQWVSNNVWVVDQAAWDEVVPGASYYLCTCGATFGDSAAVAAHVKETMLAGDMSHTYSVQTNNQTIHHDEVGHWEDQGYNQTVVTGYKCSGCGATK